MPTSRSQSLGPSAQDGRRALAGGNAEEDAESRVGVCDPAMGAGISKVVTAVSEDAEGTPQDGVSMEGTSSGPINGPRNRRNSPYSNANPHRLEPQ